jgi:hypothetical protein
MTGRGGGVMTKDDDDDDDDVNSLMFSATLCPVFMKNQSDSFEI